MYRYLPTLCGVISATLSRHFATLSQQSRNDVQLFCDTSASLRNNTASIPRHFRVICLSNSNPAVVRAKCGRFAIGVRSRFAADMTFRNSARFAGSFNCKTLPPRRLMYCNLIFT